MPTRRSVLSGLAGLPLAAAATAVLPTLSAHAQNGTADADILPTSLGDVAIHPVSHASLVLAWGDEALYVDPVGGAALYAGLPAPTAILVTHGHPDHFDLPTLQALAGNAPLVTSREVFDKLPDTLRAKATAMANGEQSSLLDLPLRAIAAHNVTEDRMQYHPVGVGNGYVLSFGDSKIYIAGDTEPTGDMLALTGITVAFLPMNLPYTMTPEQAAEAIDAFKPAVVYPYHYGDSDLSVLDTAVIGDTEIRLRDWYARGA